MCDWDINEGLPGVSRFGEQGNKGKNRRKQGNREPILRKGGTKTLQIRGRKHFDMKDKKSVISEI